MRGRRRSALVALATTLLAVALGRAYVVDTVVVTSDSMRPTLCAGDWLVLLAPGAARSTGPGDLVVFPAPDDGLPTVKRVVAVGGQQVEIRDAVLYVDGVVVPEEYVDRRTVDGTHFGPSRVPPDRVFVLGDDREHSVDSRSYGAVARRAIAGRVLGRVHSACD